MQNKRLLPLWAGAVVGAVLGTSVVDVHYAPLAVIPLLCFGALWLALNTFEKWSNSKMGQHPNIDHSAFPEQGAHKDVRVRVCFNYDTHPDRIVLGTMVRDDSEAPHQSIIALDDGRYVLGTECMYRPEGE